ncbi:MAG: ATP-binding protein [Alphaproteobacteria bacterium]|nr:ATP-binding protein [Alphaproteobacteria bacterium]
MFSRLARTINTFTFRLALVYVGLFSLSAILLFAFIYTFAMRYTDTQVSDAIRLQYSYLLNEYRENGSAGVERRIRELIAEDDESSRIFLLVNREQERLAGNLNTWPKTISKEGVFEKEGEWIRFYIESARGIPEGIEVKALTIPLSKWRFLLIGETTQASDRVKQTIIQTFWASLLVTLVMAFIGALIITRSVIHRLSIINRSAATIMRGNLSARIPSARGGDEFDELSSNLNRMLDRIEMLLLSLSQFSSNIAHDLRTPLNRIINRLDAGLRSIEPSNPAYRLLEKNAREMEGLVGTFNSILKISELEARPDSVTFEPCDLRAVIENLTLFYEPYADEKSIHFHLLTIPDGDFIIQGEKNLLTQAFANLIDNAIKFTPEQGTITIQLERGEHHASVTIADSGAGIPPEYHDKVFEKFFRLEQSRASKGNGLGLSLVAAIARIHKARITLEDNEPGLRVRMEFSI